MWLVQISAEMWDYSSPFDSGNVNAAEGEYDDDDIYDDGNDTDGICEIYFDKFVRFMYRLFEKWKELEVINMMLRLSSPIIFVWILLNITLYSLFIFISLDNV